MLSPGATLARHASKRARNWNMLGIFLSLTGLGLAGLDFFLQLFQQTVTLTTLLHLALAAMIMLMAGLMLVFWFLRVRHSPFETPYGQQLSIMDRPLPPTAMQASPVPSFTLTDQMALHDGQQSTALIGPQFVQPYPLFEEKQLQDTQREEFASSSAIPIAQDRLFAFDTPTMGERCFILPKEGDPLLECQDRYAWNTSLRCYAIADGVGGSFIPGPWASIIANAAVNRAGVFHSQEEFQNWLVERGQEWRTWMEQRWVSTMNTLRQSQGERPEDWHREIELGAQTTLVGCTIGPAKSPDDSGIPLYVFAIGDSEFFLFRPTADNSWSIQTTHPLSHPAEFGYQTEALATMPRPDLLQRAWEQWKTTICIARPGDVIVLASDAIAKWLLTEVQQLSARWIPLLTAPNLPEFADLVRQELREGRIEDDDITMLVITV